MEAADGADILGVGGKKRSAGWWEVLGGLVAEVFKGERAIAVRTRAVTHCMEPISIWQAELEVGIGSDQVVGRRMELFPPSKSRARMVRRPRDDCSMGFGVLSIHILIDGDLKLPTETRSTRRRLDAGRGIKYIHYTAIMKLSEHPCRTRAAAP